VTRTIAEYWRGDLIGMLYYRTNYHAQNTGHGHEPPPQILDSGELDFNHKFGRFPTESSWRFQGHSKTRAPLEMRYKSTQFQSLYFFFTVAE